MTDAFARTDEEISEVAAELEAAGPRLIDRPERLSWDSQFRSTITVYIPLALFVIVLLFPFYWMTITAFKPDYEMYDYNEVQSVLGAIAHAAQYRSAAVPDRVSALADDHHGDRGRPRRSCQWVRACWPRTQSSGCGSRVRSMSGLLIYLAYLVPPSILFIPLATLIYQFGLFDNPVALILTYPTFLVPFCTWLLIGYFKSIPYELEECALIDGASRLQILRRITLPLAVPGLISAGIFAFTLSWNEFIYALAFIQSTDKKTVPVAILTELVTGDVYQWGALMAGSLLGSVPVALIYSFFVEYVCLVDDRSGQGIAFASAHG